MRIPWYDESSEWVRPLPSPSELRLDYVLGALITGVMLFFLLLMNSIGGAPLGDPPSGEEQVVWALLQAVPLAWRRRFPASVSLIIGAAFIAAQVRHYPDFVMPSVVLFIALYSTGAWGRNGARDRWVRLGVIAAMFVWLAISTGISVAYSPPTFPGAKGPMDPLLALVLYNVLFNMGFFVSAYFFGAGVRRSAWRNHQLERATGELRASRDEIARQAVVAERVRIARDLHDVVAHHVSVMGVQAAAARRVLDKKPALARTSLESVEQTARTAIKELRALLGVLRSDPTAAPSADGEAADGEVTGGEAVDGPSRGIGDVASLAEDARAAGLNVEVASYGEERPIPAPIGITAYRVVQEALTNTVKHANAKAANVRVRYLNDAVEIEVTDDGVGPIRPSAPGAGLGMVGMRERVAIHGGELDAGPRRDRGFRVRALLPTGAAEEDRPSTADGREGEDRTE